MNKINLGDKVKDPVTGIEGIAYARYSYLQGCDRIGIQQATIPRKEDVPLIPDLYVVDEPQLEVVKRKVHKCQATKETKTGGPSGYSKRTNDK